MQTIQVFSQDVWNMRTQMCNETPYFCGKDVAKALGYANPQKAFRDHVFEEDRVKLENLRGYATFTPSKNEQGASIYITEPGLYALIFGSQKEEAKAFKKWVCQDVLPRLRRYYQEAAKQPLCLTNETALHHKVVAAIRRLFPHALMTAGLGELQDSPEKRLDAYRKGYVAGTPDIIILNHHKTYNGLAIELKNPRGTGKLSEKQTGCLGSYRQARFQTLVTDDYDTVLLEIFKYFQDIRLCCEMCGRKLKTQQTLARHMHMFHKCC